MDTIKLGKRIKQVRLDQQMTQDEFGQSIGVKGNTVTGYERGTRRPSDAVINSICLVYGVNQTWLRTGEGATYEVIPDSNTTLERLYSEYDCSALEIKFLDAYFSLKQKERDAFCSVLKQMFPMLEKLIGADPTSKPYAIEWQDAPSLDELERLALDGMAKSAHERTDAEITAIGDQVKAELFQEREAMGKSLASLPNGSKPKKETTTENGGGEGGKDVG